MELEPHVDRLREQLAIAAEAGGDEARALAQRLAAPLDAAIRLMLLDALEIATAEITRELAPGSVELRLRGGDPEFVVTPAPADRTGEAAGSRTRVRSSLPAARQRSRPGQAKAPWRGSICACPSS